MKFKLEKDKLEIFDIKEINSGSIAYYEADVEYDESWKDLIIEAILVKGNNKGTSTAVINSRMYIDRKLRGVYKIGFVGYTIENNQKTYQVSTNLKPIYFNQGAGEIETENTEPPTPTEWEIYNAQIQEFIKEANRLDIDAEEENGGALITITKKDGTTKQVKVEKGEKGDVGSVKFIIANELPTENIDESAIYMKPAGATTEGNTYEEYIYVDGQWESLGTANVEVDLADYVKFTDIGTKTKAGVFKIANYANGLYVDANGVIRISPPSDKNITDKKSNEIALTPNMIDLIIKVGMTTNTLEWTDEEKASARNLLGGHVTLTQAEYDALVSAGTIDENTYYYIKEE